MRVDHTTWDLVRFGEIVQSVGERVDDPGEAGVDRYVGLEHLEPDRLGVRRWGEPSQVEASKLRFCAGDVIFGKRRAYQRKGALAAFEGICSAHALVLRPRPDVVDMRFLPVLVQSEPFVQRAMKISVGSLSPTINWKTLATQEFRLPPVSEQKAIAELMWAAEDVAVKAEAAVEAAWTVEKRILEDAYADATWPLGRVKDAGEVQLGQKLNSRNQTGQFRKPYLRVANVGDDYLKLSDLLEMDFSAKEVARYALHHGDVLLIEGNGNPDEIGRAAMWHGEIEQCFFQMTLLRFRPGANALPEFAYGWLRRAYYRGDFARNSSRSTTLGHLTAARFSEMRFPMPGLDVQNEVVRCVAEARKARQALEEHARASRRLVRGLINRIFSEDIPPDELQRGEQRS